jgi:hypothetical protein
MHVECTSRIAPHAPRRPRRAARDVEPGVVSLLHLRFALIS